jgi:putative AdoMet-dependent methyltransferase
MGREFVELFEGWADSYDESVTGHDLEYKEVFLNYEMILQEVANLVEGSIVEFGVGTGNLTLKLLENEGTTVTGFEPSPTMRVKAQEKLPGTTILNGDFIDFEMNGRIDAFVSTYAFHHLTDQEKAIAVNKYSELLEEGGKVVFADTVFETSERKQETIEKAKKNHFLSLAADLETEYYTTIPVLTDLFQQNGFTIQFKQLNPFVWLIDATKKA